MAKYRKNLPQVSDEVFISDGGLETTLIFHEGWDLPEGAAFVLLENDGGRKALVEYFRRYLSIAREFKVGFILESPTWRANPAWIEKVGYSSEALEYINREAIKLLQGIRDEYESENTKIVISGCIGPRGDGYVVSDKMTAEEAEKYHTPQIRAFSHTEADVVTAFTINYVEEAIGIVRAAKSAGMPVVISFTVETDGKLPSGDTLKDAIEAVDGATENAPAYYMINCAYPTHFKDTLAAGEPWSQRVRGIRANSSSKSHAELDGAETLDVGNPKELGLHYVALRGQLSGLNVLAGCCGTDHRHIEEICKACLS